MTRNVKLIELLKIRLGEELMEWTLTGYGQNGRQLWRELVAVKTPFVGKRHEYTFSAA